MEPTITTVLIIFTANILIQGLPIENGFTVRFNPISTSEDLKPKQFGTMFAKIPQDFRIHSENRRRILAKSIFSQAAALGMGRTNQVAKLLYPFKNGFVHNRIDWVHSADEWNFINLPLMKQPYDDYKILVATAPPHMSLNSKDNDKMVIYIVFPDDGGDQSYNIPAIYFVNGKSRFKRKETVDPILIIDQNRTVTGLKSKEIAKIISFRKKLSDRFSYEVTR